MKKASMPTILLVDDDDDALVPLSSLLEEEGHTVLLARDGQQGMEVIEDHRVDAAIVDIFLPNMDGLEMIRAVKKAHPEIPILAVSGGGTLDIDFLDMATKLGANHVMHKPFRLRDFLVLLKDMLNAENDS